MRLTFSHLSAAEAFENPLIRWRFGLGTGNRRRFSETAAATLTPGWIFVVIFGVALAYAIAGTATGGKTFSGGMMLFAAQAGFWGAFGSIVLGWIVHRQEQNFARTHAVNLRMAGMSGGQILAGNCASRAAAAFILGGAYVAAAVASLALSIVEGGDGPVVWLSLGHIGTALFALGVWTALDAALWVFGGARVARFTIMAAVCFASSPLLVYHFVMDGLMNTYYVLYPTTLHEMVCLAEVASWPVRGAVAVTIWKRARARIENA